MSKPSETIRTRAAHPCAHEGSPRSALSLQPPDAQGYYKDALRAFLPADF